MIKATNTLEFNLIVCTYKRPESLKRLLDSVDKQTLLPAKILIIDGSPDDLTENLLNKNSYRNLDYYRVHEENRGLTKQRNFGVQKIDSACEIVCFLDDDIILNKTYFERLIGTYKILPEALAVSGYITNGTLWEKSTEAHEKIPGRFYFDGWNRVEGSRFGMRRKFGLAPDKNPGMMPDFSHGYSTAFLPPSGKIYEVEMLMGGLSSYRNKIFLEMSFSSYFEGYGLYEDADFSLRLAKKGKLYVNTSARLEHHHDAPGRPDKFNYGKMVIRNGWYVWRVKYPHPSCRAKFKWHATAFLLTLIRFSNVLNTDNKKEALLEAIGRISGWCSLFYSAPKVVSEK